MEIIVYAALCPEGEERETAYGLLAKALAEELGIAPLPEIRREALGKPFFPDHPGIHFSISHSHGAAVCALHDRPIGVDVEKLREPPRRVAGDLGAEEFFRLWTAKEATVKRQGRGVGAILRGAEPSALCQCLEGLLEGYVVTVCPSVEATVRTVLRGGFTPTAYAGLSAPDPEVLSPCRESTQRGPQGAGVPIPPPPENPHP